MKIIDNNYQNPTYGFIFPFRFKCRWCDSILEVESMSDLSSFKIDGYIHVALDCPLCSRSNPVDVPERML